MNFIINNQEVTISDPDPNETVLRFLRTRQALVGTKEGCASGDCGACTALLGAYRDNTIDYHSINTCITPLGALQGKHLLTVEGLADYPALHPVQQALVAAHASQCGFCTPGFVMSLAGLYMNHNRNAAPTRAAVVDAVSGNLCRCTGYRPIIDAGLDMFVRTPARPCRITERAAQRLGGINDDPGSPASGSRRYLRPRSESALQQMLAAHTGARLIAGGTDLALQISQQHRQFDTLIDLGGIESLSTIGETDTHWLIGSTAVYSVLEPFFAERFPEFLPVLVRLGSRQIRNRGTLGGNLANGSPIADTPPLLLALDAQLQIRDSSGAERRLSVQNFYHGYKQTDLADDEYLAQIIIPKRDARQKLYCYKISKRYEDDISSVMAAITLRSDDQQVTTVRIAFGGVAATPIRSEAAETKLIRSKLGGADVDQACHALADTLRSIDDVRASAAYRIAMAQNLLRKAIDEHTLGRHTSVFDYA